MKEKILKFLLLALVATVAFLAFGIGLHMGKSLPTDKIAPQEKVTYNPIDPIPSSPQLSPLQAAQAANPDTVAWLTIPGTEIDEAVVQAKDNDYYLRRDALGNPEQWGCTFSDYINDLSSRRNLHPNSILYGHSHNSENPELPQFTQLFRYRDIDFLRENPAFTVVLVSGETLTFQVAAVFYTGIDFDYIDPFPEEEYYNSVKAKNLYQFKNIELAPDSKLLTLSTCAYKYDTNHTGDHRFVVVGKLLEDGENEIVPIVEENPEPKLPKP